MSFQKCPICNGTGDDPFVLELPRSTYPCPTCKGVRIIDDVTGLPPVIEEKHNIFEPVEPCNADIQNAFVCNPEYRRADLKATSDAFTIYAKTISTQTTTQNGSNISSRESQVPESGS
jgi:hypothetical protein